MPSNKKRIKPEIVETVASGNVSKKMKIEPRDPFLNRYVEISLDVPNTTMSEVMEKFFGEGVVNPSPVQITKYRTEQSGVAKTICGETLFVEEIKTSFSLVCPTEKKQIWLDELNKRFCAVVIVNK